MDGSQEINIPGQPGSEDARDSVSTAGPPVSGPAATSFEELVYRQDLNEVYLLLDFISGRPDKRLSDLDNKISGSRCGDKSKLGSAEIIARVSNMRYPPHRPEEERASEAALLLELKDWLNWMAYPARGLTIAYTTMFTEGSGGLGHGLWNGLVRIFRRRTDGLSPVETQSSRIAMAHLAFPGLIAHAAYFRLVKRLLSLSGLVLSLLSAFCLWQATYGVRLAGHFADAKRGETEMIAKLFNQLEKEGKGTAVAQLPGSLNDFCTPPKDSGVRLASAKGPGSPAIDAKGMTPATRLLCSEYSYQHALLEVAIADLSKYSCTAIFQISVKFLPIHDVSSEADCAAASGSSQKSAGDWNREEDAPSVAAMLAMMTTYLLPMSFGIVGTIAALLRAIQRRVNESTLSPRDLALSLFRLPLGMVAGICVGLFFTPSGNLVQTGGELGALTLSASGVAFLAGYGAEGFFRTLDALVAHLFNLDRAQPQRSPG
jgi:hypothetical protein